MGRIKVYRYVGDEPMLTRGEYGVRIDGAHELEEGEEGELVSLLVCSPWPKQVSPQEMAADLWYAYYAWPDGSDGWYLGPFASRAAAEAYRHTDEPDAVRVRVFRGADPECPRLVPTEWVARYLGIAERTVRKWAPRWPGAQKVGRDWVIPTDRLGWWHEQDHQPGPKGGEISAEDLRSIREYVARVAGVALRDVEVVHGTSQGSRDVPAYIDIYTGDLADYQEPVRQRLRSVGISVEVEGDTLGCLTHEAIAAWRANRQPAV